MCLKANNTLHSDQLAVIFWYCHHIKQGFDYTGCQSKELPPHYQTRVWLHWVFNRKYCHHIKQGFGYNWVSIQSIATILNKDLVTYDFSVWSFWINTVFSTDSINPKYEAPHVSSFFLNSIQLQYDEKLCHS